MNFVDPRIPVGRIATTHPGAIAVFEHHHIDYCCGGARPLDECCAELGLDLFGLLAEIAATRPPAGADLTDWEAVSPRDLVDHIEVHYHRSLEQELPRLRGLLRKVASVHTQHRARFAPLEDALDALRDELEPHIKKEEEVLFPWLRSGHGQTAAAAVKVLAEEHESVGALLLEIRAATDGYVAPADACSTWRTLWDGLHALERDLHAHIHLENNVLFPRALA